MKELRFAQSYVLTYSFYSFFWEIEYSGSTSENGLPGNWLFLKMALPDEEDPFLRYLNNFWKNSMIFCGI